MKSYDHPKINLYDEMISDIPSHLMNLLMFVEKYKDTPYADKIYNLIYNNCKSYGLRYEYFVH